MIRAVADTHAVIWYFWDDPRLGDRASPFFDSIEFSGGRVAISAISLVEIVYLSEKRRIDPRTLEGVMGLLDLGEVFIEVPVDDSILPSLAAIPRAQVPDMPDRIIVATAGHLGVPLISRDAKIRASAVTTIW